MLQPVRGTHDLLPDDARRHRFVTDTARETALRFGFREIATPIFEFTEVFTRTLGETSDIVTKEMYTFLDQGGDSLTLRPEGTAGVARALISGGLAQNLPLKFFYAGPMFRYERPQKGRLRQFHQIGVECLGQQHPFADAEAIAAGAAILDLLGVGGKVTLEINTLGDTESRLAYRTELVAYLEKFRDDLSSESRERLARNPLRILDSKNKDDRAVIANAPVFSDFLTDDAAAFFATVCRGLDGLGIGYVVNPRLVRGLDYYCHTAFEFTTDALGAQGTVLAGGRYDGLIRSMGGPSVPGVGWAAGIERLSMLIGDAGADPAAIAVVPVGDGLDDKALTLAATLRRAGFRVETTFQGNLKKRMKFADKVGARCAVIFGEDEVKKGVLTLRDLRTGAQEEVVEGEIGRAVSRLLTS